jgi:hypothetical protein
MHWRCSLQLQSIALSICQGEQRSHAIIATQAAAQSRCQEISLASIAQRRGGVINHHEGNFSPAAASRSIQHGDIDGASPHQHSAAMMVGSLV